MPKPAKKQASLNEYQVDETPTFDARITYPICGTAIPTVKMDMRFLARDTCANCKSDFLIEGEKPQA